MAYKVYTTEFDEVIRPTDLVELEELKKLAETFHSLCPIENFEPLKERLEQLTVPEESTVVTLLIDNSGSMRGKPMSFAIGTAGIISMYLDRLGIANEILGFTTTAWRGGKVYDQYIKETGLPKTCGLEVKIENPEKKPGRLCPLRHIVYKETIEQLVDVRHNLALMFKYGLMKENVDGEAVLWACERLRAHPAKRRILLVVSDGAPIDDITQTVNGNEYLSDHLKQIIGDLNVAGDIQLDAIGMGHDVCEYYGVGDKVMEVEELAPVAIGKLEALLHTA